MGSLRSRLRDWQAWLPLTLLCLTILALFYRLLFGDVIFWGLPSLQFYPWREFAMRELAQGRLPLWNPYNGAGAPLLANYQIALLYPPHLLYFLWSGPQMMGFIGLLHLLWAGIGMWLLTGRLKCGVLGRGIATLAYPLSTPIVARFGTIPMLEVAAWLPFLLLATDLLLARVTLRNMLLLTGVVAMQLLVGHAQWTFYSFVLAGSYALWRLIAERKTLSPRRTVWIVLAAMVALVLGVGLTAAQLLPTAELQRQSQRASGLDEAFALNFSYTPLSVLTLFNPNFFGNPSDGSYVVGGAYFEVTAYLGILPLALAILGTGHFLRTRWRRRKNKSLPDLPGLNDVNQNLIPFFASTALIAFILALGKFGIYPLLYRYVPTFNLFQAPARWLLVAIFSLVMLAALSADLWQPERRARHRTRIVLIGAISITAAGFVAQVLLRSATPITEQLVRGLTIAGILATSAALLFLSQPDESHPQWSRWAMGVLLFVAADLWWANSLSNPTVPPNFYDKLTVNTTTRTFWPDPKNQQLPQAAFDRFLLLNDYRAAVELRDQYRRSGLPNLNLLDRQPSLNNFDPLRPDGIERFSRLLNMTLHPGLLRAAAVGQVYGSSDPVTSPTRVWIAPTVMSFHNSDDVEKFIGADGWNPEQTVAIEGDQGDLTLPTSTQPGTARLTDETPLDLSITAESPGGGMLVLADTYYPGWQATLDGSPTTIYRANLAFRGVVVPAGTHMIRMQYQPTSWQVGSVISVIALAIYGLLWIRALFATPPPLR
ncbi:MAG: YfhO family protein [Chloroflexota bacterium]